MDSTTSERYIQYYMGIKKKGSCETVMDAERYWQYEDSPF